MWTARSEIEISALPSTHVQEQQFLTPHPPGSMLQLINWSGLNQHCKGWAETKTPGNFKTSCFESVVLTHSLCVIISSSVQYDRVWRAGNDTRTLHRPEVRHFMYHGALCSNGAATRGIILYLIKDV